MTYNVIVQAMDGDTVHSTHDHYRDAVDQADLIHGRIQLSNGVWDAEAWEYAVAHQGYDGDYDDWTSMDEVDRAEYESGAAGIPT